MTELEKFIYEHGDELLRLAYTYVKNKQAAEDIVQDVLLKAFEKQEYFRGESSYRTYLYRMTINRSYDYLRSWHDKHTTMGEKIQRLIGTLLNCSPATVRTRLARGREKLKTVLKEDGFDGTIENGIWSLY